MKKIYQDCKIIELVAEINYALKNISRLIDTQLLIEKKKLIRIFHPIGKRQIGLRRS